MPEAIQHLITRLDRPSYVTGRRLDLLAWNDAAAELLTGCDRRPDEDPQHPHLPVARPPGVAPHGPGWPEEARRVGPSSGPPTICGQPTPPLSTSPPGCAATAPNLPRGGSSTHSILTSGNGHKTPQDSPPPRTGRPHVQLRQLQADDHPALKLSIYTPF
ncbi:hypothetical protein ACFW1M_35315 [Streptomyces inhibens]|uniref:MmyB family transcriptional regulator n=1 Tax=Streptomyces inhibens TaxID=2293571 RepID=UPI0036D01917